MMKTLSLLVLLVVCGVSSTFAVDPASGTSYEANLMELLKGAQQAAAVDAQLDKGAVLLETEAPTDLKSSVTSLLSMEKAKNEDAYKTLFLEQSGNSAVQSKLAEERTQLRERGVFLERLQGCLNEGPTEDKLKALETKVFDRETEVMKAREDLAAFRRDAASRESSFVAREELSHRKNDAINNALTKASSASSLLEAKAAQLSQHEQLVRQSEAELAGRVETLNAREEALNQSEKRLAASVRALRAQSASLAETRNKHREVSFLEVASACSDAKDCGKCSARAECGWCAASADGKQGKCLPHNVNSASDGLTSGQCALKNWYSKVADRITVLNLNVHGSDLSDKEQRAASLFNVIISANFPDFVAFQDVSDWFLESLRGQNWFRTYYHLTEYPVRDGIEAAPGGLALMSRFEVKRTSYTHSFKPSFHNIDQFPRVLVAEFELADKAFTVATTAMDWRTPNARAAALDFVAGVTSTTENLILLGDFGFDDGAEPESSHVPTDWLDVWLRVHNATGTASVPTGPKARGPNHFGYTWDPISNLYARGIDSAARAARIDRVFLRSSSFLPRDIALVGCPAPDYLCQDPPAANAADNMLPYTLKPVDPRESNETWPSPRYGLLATLSIFAQHC